MYIYAVRIAVASTHIELFAAHSMSLCRATCILSYLQWCLFWDGVC